jgi:hypothetical protein
MNCYRNWTDSCNSVSESAAGSADRPLSLVPTVVFNTDWAAALRFHPRSIGKIRTFLIKEALEREDR